MSGRRNTAWLARFVRAYRRDVAAALGLGLAASGCAALLMFTSGYLISATAMAGVTLFSIMVPVGFVQIFGFGRPAARYVERLMSHNWVLRVTSDLRALLYRAVAERTGDPARERATGEYLGLLADDVAHLQNLYLRVVFPTAIAYALAIGAAIAFGFFSPPFALVIALSFIVIVGLLPLACRLSTRALVEAAREAKAREYVSLADDVYGSVDWVLARRGSAVCQLHVRNDAEVRAIEWRVRMTQRSITLASMLLLVAVLCGVIAWSAGQFGAPGANVNWIAAFALGFFPLLESFSLLPAAVSESTVHKASVERLGEFLQEGESEKATPEHDEAAPQAPDTAATTLEQPAIDLHCPQAIEFEEVAYTYPGSTRAALTGLTLQLPRGKSVAVLGRSGAGKSTFASLACGVLAPDAGHVRILGADISRGGFDLSAAVGYVGQTPYLFNRTLRDNLTLGVNESSDEELAGILKAVGLGGKLSALPNGLDTVIGETGVGLSGGEAHRVAVARVLVADTPIVVVDEPFSALDPETEAELLDTLLTALAGRTLVVITHHLAQIERFDRVIFIENGMVDLNGSPQKLRKTNARFQALMDFDRWS